MTSSTISDSSLSAPSLKTAEAKPNGVARRRRTRRVLTRAASGVAAVAAVAGIAYAWRPKPLAVDVAVVTEGDLVVMVEEVARTRVRDRYLVSAPLGGNLLRSELRAGDSVAAGAVVARITPMDPPLLDPRTRAAAVAQSAAASAGERQASAAVARAEVAARHADDELGRTRRLVASGSLADDALLRGELEARLRSEELASARFAVQMAAHETAMARATLARFGASRAADGFDVPAPAAGRVLRVLAPNAAPVQPGAPLLEIGDPAALEIVADVLSADAVKIQPGARVTLERWGGEPLAAHVRRIEPSGFTRLSALGVEEQRVPIVVDLDDPRERWAALGDGFRVEVRIVVEQKRAVLRLPVSAVFRHGDRWATYVVDDGRARRVPVSVGVRNDVEVEVTGGLAPKSTVILHPSEQVKDGVKVVSRS